LLKRITKPRGMIKRGSLRGKERLRHAREKTLGGAGRRRGLTTIDRGGIKGRTNEREGGMGKSLWDPFGANNLGQRKKRSGGRKLKSLGWRNKGNNGGIRRSQLGQDRGATLEHRGRGLLGGPLSVGRGKKKKAG